MAKLESAVGAGDFEAHRSLLWKLSYRMTGSAADAEDIVQDTFTRFLERPPEDTQRDVRPWLVQVALNLSRDHLRRRKRQAYVGPWLPSPIETSGSYAHVPGPEARYSELESVSMAFLTALEVLSSSQRAVILLRDVLGYSVRETADALEMSEANVKTTHHRARAALENYDRTRVLITPELQKKTQAAMQRFMLLLTLGDDEGIKTMLAEDACARNDSNGEAIAARVPIFGHERIITFHRKVQKIHSGVPMFRLAEINGLPAMIGEFSRHDPGYPNEFVFFVTLNADGKIQLLDTVVASIKLTHVRYQTR